MHKVAVKHIADIMRVFDGFYNPPNSNELTHFAQEYESVYSVVLSRATEFFHSCDILEGDEGVQISPRKFASSRKVGFIVDSPEYHSPEFLDWLVRTVLEINGDYLITVDMYTELGQVYLCVSKERIDAWGPRKALVDIGIQTDEEYTPIE
jgi:hypothetical protein